MKNLQNTISKIETSNSIVELNKIQVVVNTPSIGWSENDKLVLNARIEDTKYIINETRG